MLNVILCESGLNQVAFQTRLDVVEVAPGVLRQQIDFVAHHKHWPTRPNHLNEARPDGAREIRQVDQQNYERVLVFDCRNHLDVFRRVHFQLQRNVVVFQEMASLANQALKNG